MKEFNAFIGPSGLLAFGIIFLLLGLLTLVWLLLYVEADPDRNFRGSIARAIAVSMFLGVSIYMFMVRAGFVI